MKSEILNRLKEIANSDDVLSQKKEFNELKSQLQNLLDHGIAAVHEDERQEEAETSSVDQAEESGPDDPSESVTTSEEKTTPEFDSKEEAAEDSEGLEEIRNELHEVSTKFKEKVKQLKEAKAKLEQETVEEAQKILAEMKELVAEEENIGKAFARFNEIMQHWKALPKVSNDDYRDLNADYNKYVEQFFYNINIYKELKELDLKHNLDEKNAVLTDQKKLLNENDIRLLEVEVRMNQERWNEIGPTFKDEWDKIKGEFWETTRAIYGKIQEFYDGRREEQEKNYEAKKQLLEKVRHIASLDLKSAKKWQDKSNELKAIQKEWKMIGYVPKAKSGELWKEFKSLCDTFFDNKRKQFEELREVQNANKEKKVALLEKANELKDSEDWKETSHALIRLQKEWKEIGPAHQRDENKLWRQFREACDSFFKRRNEHRDGRGDREKANLEAKEALLSELEKWSPEKGERDKNIAALKDFGEKWRQIGFVPFSKKDEIGSRYKNLMDEKYQALDIDTNERKKIRLEEKIETLKDSNKSDVLIRREQDHVRNKISKLNSDIIQFENNMGFFANSKGADKLKEEVEKKIEKARREIDALKEQLSMLRDA